MELIKGSLRGGRLQAKAVFRFFKVGGDGNRLHLFVGETGQPAVVFELPRQD